MTPCLPRTLLTDDVNDVSHPDMWDAGCYDILAMPGNGILQWLPEEPEVKRDWFGVMAPPAPAKEEPWRCSNDTCKTPTAGPRKRKVGGDDTECVACADGRIARQMEARDAKREPAAHVPALPQASPATMGGFVARPGGRFGQWR
jgi:hypothetical protein